MSDNSTSSLSYETVIETIASLDEVQKAVVKDKNAMISFVDSVVKGETEIAKFVQLKSQIETYLDNYDFKCVFQFDEINNKIGSVLTLRSKLAVMADEAKKLLTYPDRYGSQKAVALCRDLSIKCKEKIKLEETQKAIALAEANTQKLILIRGQFESDGDILIQINEAIDANMNVLGKFKAYLAEIHQYVDEFPHSGQDDWDVVNSRIETAWQINSLLEQVQKNIEQIKGNFDRHNLKAVLIRFQSVVNEMSSKMRYADVGKYKTILNDINKQVQKVVVAFEEERKDLQSIYDSLMSRSSCIWKNDTEEMIKKLEGLFRYDTKTIEIDLSKIKADIKRLANNRTKDIKNTIDEYPWLENDNYREFHTNLVKSYITKSDYLSRVDEARKERIRKIWKWIGISVGAVCGVALIIFCFYVLLALIVIKIVISFLSNRDD